PRLILLRAALGRSVVGFLAAHLDIAAGRRALLAVLGRILASAFFALLLLAALFGFFLERLLGGCELEVFEQPPRQFCEGGLIVERHRQSVELGAGFVLDP